MVQDAHTASPFVEVGRIIRSHGLDGELKVEFEYNNEEALSQITMMYLRNERGDFFPARVKNTRVEGKGNKLSFFVQFEHIADRTSADALKNRALFLEPELAGLFLAEEEISYLHFDVYDEQDQHVGIVTDVLESPAQLTLVVASPDCGNLLVPFVDQYIKEVDEENERMSCRNLELLSEL